MEQPRDRIRWKQRRRTATQVNRFEIDLLETPGFLEHCVDVLPNRDALPYRDGEVAIRTTTYAERDMEVQMHWGKVIEASPANPQSAIRNPQSGQPEDHPGALSDEAPQLELRERAEHVRRPRLCRRDERIHLLRLRRHPAPQGQLQSREVDRRHAWCGGREREAQLAHPRREAELFQDIRSEERRVG